MTLTLDELRELRQKILEMPTDQAGLILNLGLRSGLLLAIVNLAENWARFGDQAEAGRQILELINDRFDDTSPRPGDPEYVAK